MLRNRLRLFAAIILLVLAFAGAGMWLRGYSHLHYAILTIYGQADAKGYGMVKEIDLSCVRGTVFFLKKEAIERIPIRRRPTWEFGTGEAIYLPPETFWQSLGFCRKDFIRPYYFPSAKDSPILGLPCWLIELLLLTASFYFFTKWRKHRPHPKGHCQQCGYDLRETPERCPECGTP